MICKSCGAEFSAELLQCPFCGTENEKEAVEQQEEYIKQVEQKIEAVKEMPKEVAKKANSWLTKLVIGIVILAIVILVGAFLIVRLLDATSVQRQQKKLDKLEAMYQAEQYEEMEEYLLNIEEFDGAFRKYRIVAQIYSDQKSTVGLLESYIKVVETSPDSKIVDDYAERLMGVMKEMSYLDELEENGFVYGEGELVNELRAQYIQALKEYMLLTEEEITMAREQYANGENEFLDLKQLTLQRVSQ